MKKAKKQSKEEDLVNDIKRVQADFINFKKRVEVEKEQYSQYRIEQFVLSLIDVIDNLELALRSIDDEGVKLVHKQLLDVLERNKVKKIENNEKFNPEMHEAVEKVKGEENKILDVVKEGYMYNNKIIRPTQVKVGGGK